MTTKYESPDKFLFTTQEGQPANANDPADDMINIYPFHEMNTSDGAEFIDDNIRMKPQPYHYSGELE